MSRNARDRWLFCAVSLLLFLLAVTYRPAIHGNSPEEIARYLRWEMAGQKAGPIELLAVEDDGIDRFAVFRCIQQEPDDRWVIRFRQNENGDYEAYLDPRRMYGPYPAGGVYTEPLRGYFGDREVCYIVWNESEKLAEVRFRLDYGPVECVPILKPPSLTIWRFQGGVDGWHLETSYFDGAGNEL